MRKYFYLLIISFLLVFTSCKTSNNKAIQSKPATFTVAFYNVENLFDTIHDEGKSDKEFMPNSKKKWNTKRYNQKLKQLAWVIDSIGAETLPDIVGLEEVENRRVLEDLVKQEALADANYQIIHYESPDFRGIDNAMLYNPKYFTSLSQIAIPVNMPDSIATMGKHKVTSRDILYVKGLVHGTDTLHVFVNHWTSMYYGEDETVPHRKYCAYVAKHHVDSILAINKEAKILLGGDFNEDVFSPAINGVMNPDTLYDQPKFDRLYNLSHYLFTVKGEGTYNYRGVWGTLDHLFVSGALLDTKQGFHTSKDKAFVFKAEAILNKYNNRNGKGVRPNRTYGGNSYYGGYSDHLPIFIQFKTSQ